MARAIWNGAIGFGLVNIPVKLYSAVEQKDIAFHQFQKGTGKRIHNKRVAEGSDKEVAFEDIEKGYETSKGKFVMLTPEELESVEPGRSRTIEIAQFVDLHEVDPVYWERPYYLGPAEGSEKSYVLLREALERSERIALANFVMRSKQYLATIRPHGKVMMLHTMLFPDEIRDAADVVDNLPSRTTVAPKELKIAEQLVESLTEPFDPKQFRDTYRDAVLDLVKRKGKGEEITVEEEEDRGGEVLDLMKALEESVRAARRGTRRPAKASAAKKRKAPAKKATAKRSAARKKAARKAS
jgi:DNA end-binding protein Ku